MPGHWESDLIAGTKNSHIATLVERHSRFTALVKVRSKDTAAVVAALSRRRSLIWDRRLETAKHKSFTVATNVKVYFCDPHSPWQRGTNENTNRLLRPVPAEENRSLRIHAISTGQGRTRIDPPGFLLRVALLNLVDLLFDRRG